LTGDSLWSDARRDEALAMFRRAVERSGTDQTAPLRLAEALLAQGMSDEAERVFETVLMREPGNARALSGSARLRLARGDTDGALQRIQDAIHADSKRRSFFELLVAVHKARRDDAAAADVKLPLRQGEAPWPDRYLDAVDSRRVTLPAISRRAARLVSQGHGQEALALTKMAATRYPNNAEALAGVGQIYFVLGQQQEAEAQLRKALSLDPASSDARIALGRVLSAQSRCADAVEEFRRVLAARPDAAEAHLELGDCLYQLGDKDGAEAATRLAVRYEPDNVQAHMNLGTVLYQQGRYDQALEELTAAAQLMPGDDQQRAQTIERLKSELNRRKQTRPERNRRP
jgi:tetratricopeptide (TPR) repeat protein